MKHCKLLFSIALITLLAACDQSSDTAMDKKAALPADAPPPPPPGSLSVDKSPVKNTKELLTAALAGEHRSAEHRARDKYRHPVETLLFFGLKPNMTVVELWPGGGWYTEVLAPVLHDNGRLIAAAYPANSDVEYYRKGRAAYDAKLAANPAVYGSVKVIDFMPPEHGSLGPANSADMVVTFRNLHNWYSADVLDEVFAAAYEVLKPGGIFGVTEHRAKPGTAVEDVADTGYMPAKYVITAAHKAGFQLAQSSEINANPADTKDYPKGVWTLPPTLALGEENKQKYLAIGESDRMTLKFIKPKNELK
ncbi:MAG TPA: methyltransferase [Gammaproteobacteria bacterium]|nr:methyltransferase [Gammaproteobacteria bacterium]